MLLDQRIDLILALRGQAVKIVGKATCLIVDIITRVPEQLLDLFRLLLAEIALEEHLHS